ncbi:MerR family DNA-binding protein [Streptomyces silvisoli]|uniref:MerR family DNA-binding protein n=1 Tax=Streptomyces silvisoli TaxID=3034235 RepID=A0ABT5ZX26_9ACTN|nr:MerR family DNA-binding protein [Streptomyces silvisoli]MDF3294201.1 MerR family DNA-binding protein [Streptomyces silvisoli]
MTVEDVRACAHRLDLVEGDTLPPCGAVPGAAPGVAARRLAALDAQIDRLTRLRERLAARLEGGSAAA